MLGAELGLLVGAVALAVVVAGVVLGARRWDQQERDRGRVTYALAFSRDVTAGQVLVFVRTLAGMTTGTRSLLGRDSVAFEAVGTAAGIRHYLRLPAGAVEHHVRQIQAAVPGVRLSPAEPAELAPTRVRELRLTRWDRQLRIDQSEAVGTAVLAALSPLAAGEQLVWQWVVTPAAGTGRGGTTEVSSGVDWKAQLAQLFGGTPSKPSAEQRRAAREKAAEPLFVAVGRIGARGPSAARSSELLARLERVVASLAAPGYGCAPVAVARMPAGGCGTGPSTGCWSGCPRRASTTASWSIPPTRSGRCRCRCWPPNPASPPS